MRINQPIFGHAASFVFLKFLHTIDTPAAGADDFNDEIRRTFQVPFFHAGTVRLRDKTQIWRASGQSWTRFHLKWFTKDFSGASLIAPSFQNRREKHDHTRVVIGHRRHHDDLPVHPFSMTILVPQFEKLVVRNPQPGAVGNRRLNWNDGHRSRLYQTVQNRYVMVNSGPPSMFRLLTSPASVVTMWF